MPSKQQKKRAAKKVYYQLNKVSITAKARDSYKDNPAKKNEACRQYYATHKQQRKSSLRKYKGKHKHCYYLTHKDQIKAARVKYYAANTDKEVAASRARYLKNAKSVVKRARNYYTKYRARCCSDRNRRYQLAEPKPLVKQDYIREVTKSILGSKVSKELIQAFQHQHQDVASEMTKDTCKRAASSIAATRLVYKALQVRKYFAGTLLKAVRSITKIDINQLADFGEGMHCAHSEPFFYESAYVFSDRPEVLSVDELGACRPAKEVYKSDKIHTWKCSTKCKPLTKAEVNSIVKFKSTFNESMCELRKTLDTCDQCPNNRYSKVIFTADEDCESTLVHHSSVQRMGHSLLCFTGNDCNSQLRILRTASTHFSVLLSFLRLVYSALSSHKCIAAIDEALQKGNFIYLITATDVDSYDTLFSNEVQTSHELLDGDITDCVLRRSDFEKHLQTAHAKMIALYKKQLEDYPQNPCCSCNLLLQHKQGSNVRFSDELGTVWPALKDFILEEDSQADTKSHFMCHYCKSSLRSNKMPPRCVLNGLQTAPIPKELSKLDSLSTQLIQRAKAFQTVVRLGAYTKKVPAYNSLKACKGSVFFLPLPLSRTLETLESVEGTLADPELYIIVNNKPTKNNVVWRSLVDVNNVKAAIDKLRECNWLYKDVSDESVDSAAKEVIEVVSNTSSTMLEKASASDVAGLQSYTVKDLDNMLSTESDIEQYKLLSVQEEPLDSRQKHLDVMCFPVLLPDGNFGKFHPRQVKVSHSEYIKARLMNKDPRFRKDAQYLFYLLKQKEMRELKAGVYNLLKTCKSVPTSVSNLLQQVKANDQQLESNLSTMFQSIRGTKQYWYMRKSELMCMLREYGPQSLFITFSCNEYESPDINEYLRTVNTVPANYSISRLCTEDPVSVSREFSHKFHAFFQTMIIKGEALGPVEHFYWKKEYQARGAPHYHVILWIRDAPVIGKDPSLHVHNYVSIPYYYLCIHSSRTFCV